MANLYYSKKTIMFFINNKVSEINNEQWSQLLASSKVSTFFQSRECYDFYASLSFLTPFCFSLSEDNYLKAVLVGYIEKDGGKVKQFFSRRAIVNGGVLLSEDISDEALSAFLSYCKKQVKGEAIYIEFRNFKDYSNYKEIFRSNGFVYEPHLDFQIDTSSEEVMKQNLGKSRSRDLKFSLRDGAQVVTDPSYEEVNEFYQVLESLYKTKVKTPLFPFEFFDKLYHEPFSKFVLVRYQEKIIGGTVCVGDEGGTLFEWFACGKDGVYKNIYPSTVATYSGIEYAVQNDFPVFDMMGAGNPDESYGVRDFKSKFGGKLVEFGRYKCILNKACTG